MTNSENIDIVTELPEVVVTAEKWQPTTIIEKLRYHNRNILKWAKENPTPTTAILIVLILIIKKLSK